ncbi:hypothetical protein ROA7745_02108 [Roseovarius aestuarii]|uniref:Uncharacterized protein n=1 Tax=Roseovarius aestuarii TaxID=475083 RepID=A0A1X7BRU6_9RHOB|nr:hypothetical protein ROA7745_02108 [Roseovarius aestuarii]
MTDKAAIQSDCSIGKNGLEADKVTVRVCYNTAASDLGWAELRLYLPLYVAKADSSYRSDPNSPRRMFSIALPPPRWRRFCFFCGVGAFGLGRTMGNGCTGVPS